VECHAMAAQKKEKNPFLPDQGQSCWIWFAPKTGKNDEKPSTRDAAALPHNAAAHEARLQKGLWGKKAYRLSPAVFVADAFDGTALVRERSATGMASIKVKAGLILPWYEGLLVLEELMRKNENEDSCPWVTELLDVILKEKSQRNISASLYVSKSLLNAAVTGPAFVTREGRIVAHRRSPLRDDSQLTEAEVSPPGWYRVDRLERYLPPWEAFAHPKCGLYQDFYLVQWRHPARGAWLSKVHLGARRMLAGRSGCSAHLGEEAVAGGAEGAREKGHPKSKLHRRQQGTGPRYKANGKWRCSGNREGNIPRCFRQGASRAPGGAKAGDQRGREGQNQRRVAQT